MKRQLLVLVTCLTVSYVSVADAAQDPCTAQRNQQQVAQNQLYNAQRNLTNAQNTFYSAQNQSAFRLDMLNAQIAQAQANLQISGAITGGQAANCAIRSIFGRIGGGCFAGAATSAIIRQARARSYYNMTVTRYNNYVAYLNNYLRRLSQRVVVAQIQYDQANAQYQAATVAYQKCEAAN